MAEEPKYKLGRADCLCGCGKKFVPKTGWHVFYSNKCKHTYNRDMARKGKNLAPRQNTNLGA